MLDMTLTKTITGNFPRTKKVRTIPPPHAVRRSLILCFILCWLVVFPPVDQSSKSGRQAQSVDEPSEMQRRRVDVLLSEVVKKFPPKAFTGKVGG